MVPAEQLAVGTLPGTSRLAGLVVMQLHYAVKRANRSLLHRSVPEITAADVESRCSAFGQGGLFAWRSQTGLPRTAQVGPT